MSKKSRPHTSVPRRILLLTHSFVRGGPERVLSILMRHLDRARFEIHLGLVDGRGPHLAEIPDDVIVHDLRVSRLRFALPSIVRLVRKIRPQTILVTPTGMNLAATLVKPFLPRGTVLILREVTIVSMSLPAEFRPSALWSWFYRRLYKRAHKVVCLSDAMMDDVVTNFHVPREKLVRIYNPVDLHRVRRLAEAKANPYSGPGPHLAAAGWMCRAKGFDTLLDAMPAVRRRLPQATLTILGQGPLLDDLTRRAAALGLNEAVRFPGFQRNPWPYIKYADLFVLSSRYEGLPNVLLEALVLGTPIVATDCPSAIREIQTRHPEIIMAPPESPEQLADAIVAACETSALTARLRDRSGIFLGP